MSTDNKKKALRFVLPFVLALSLIFNLVQISDIDRLKGELDLALQEVAWLSSAGEREDTTPTAAPTPKQTQGSRVLTPAEYFEQTGQTPPPTDSQWQKSAPASESEQITVFVSDASSTIHSKSGCSGMKYYESMTLAEAREVTSKYCKKCGSKLKNIE